MSVHKNDKEEVTRVRFIKLTSSKPKSHTDPLLKKLDILP